MLSTVCKKFSRQHSEIFFLVFFFQKIGFDILCKLSPMATICMKCPILFSGKNKKNFVNLLPADCAQGELMVKLVSCSFEKLFIGI